MATSIVALAFFVAAAASAAAADVTKMTSVNCYGANGAGGEIELVVKSARLNIQDGASFTTRLYHYNGVPMFPGPTIRMKPHQRCRITLVNDLSTVHCLRIFCLFYC
jgi:FtsP/CotA-like multicopper oxidase with cupredoxin domain